MYEFKVSGMTCPSCKRAITNALEKKEQNVRVHVDMNSQTVHVLSIRSIEDVARTLEEAGYPVLESSAEEAAETL